jgi:hypothetical protein
MNDDQQSNPLPKKEWWRDRAIIVGILGVIATIVVGVVTYLLTEGTVSREYQERVRAARNDVLTAVGRSIGEGKVPNKAKIRAVISSVERQYGIKAEDSEKPEALIDDIVERVLANEFLDAQRREELSTQLLAVKDEQAPVSAESQPKQQPTAESKNAIAFELAGAAAAITAFPVILVSLRLLSNRSGDQLFFRTLFPIAIVFVVVLTLVVLVSLLPEGQELLKNLQKH